MVREKKEQKKRRLDRMKDNMIKFNTGIEGLTEESNDAIIEK